MMLVVSAPPPRPGRCDSTTRLPFASSHMVVVVVKALPLTCALVVITNLLPSHLVSDVCWEELAPKLTVFLLSLPFRLYTDFTSPFGAARVIVRVLAFCVIVAP